MKNLRSLVFLLIILILSVALHFTSATSYKYKDIINNNDELIYNCNYGYNLLDDNSKIIYNKIKSKCDNFDYDTSSIELGDELIVSTEDFDLSFTEKIKILNYFIYDNPQYFWLNSMHGINDNYISLKCHKKYATKLSRDTAWNTIKTTIDGYISAFNNANLKNNYEKEKFIHDIIIDNTTPCFSSWNPNEYYKSTIEGVFCDYKTADSSGYGKAFTLLMNATGQKCICSKCICKENYMTSGVCAVNIDNNWYWTDVYRDDLNNSISTDYLNFSNITFNEQYEISHQPDLMVPFIYEFPQMSDTKYEIAKIQKPVYTLNLETDMQIKQGEDLTLTINVEDYDNVSFVWYKDDEIIEGETSDTLIINNTAKENSGTYKVCAINSEGALTESEFSNECIVTVLAPPKITTDLQPAILANEGGTVTLSILAEGEKPLTYEWFKDDVLLENQTQNSLIIENANLLDSGNYKVIVTDNNMQAVESSICNLSITKITPIKIINDLQTSVLEYEGNPVALYVTAEGKNPLTYKWYRNDVLLENQNKNCILFASASLLDSGKYKVQITDSLQQTIESSVCNLVIVKKPLLVNAITPNQEQLNNDEHLDNITVPIIKLQNLDTVYENINSKSENTIKCANIYYNKEKSKAIKSTVEINSSDISSNQLGSNEEFNTNMIEILKSIASLNIDSPTRSFELFSKRFDTRDDFKVMTFSKDMKFPFSVKVTFTIPDSTLNNCNYYFYYFNDEEKALDLCEKTSVTNNKKFKVELNHCCEYIISPKEISVLDIPYQINENNEIANEIENNKNPQTSQNKNLLYVSLLSITALYCIKRFKN